MLTTIQEEELQLIFLPEIQETEVQIIPQGIIVILLQELILLTTPILRPETIAILLPEAQVLLQGLIHQVHQEEVDLQVEAEVMEAVVVAVAAAAADADNPNLK